MNTSSSIEPPLLEVRNLEVRRGERLLCRDLSFTCRPGEVWGILGENGSGKTSLLHTLAAIEPITDGDVRVRQTPLAQWRRKALARVMGLLPQQSQEAFPLRVEEVVAFGRFPHRNFWQSPSESCADQIDRALTLLNLDTKRHRFLHELSGGEQQRVAIAALLVQDPALVMLDEPCNHLDLRHQVRILVHFQELAARDKTILMALHDVNLASRYCSHVILLFPAGETQVGAAQTMLTEENLTRLYSHPIREIPDGDNRLWLPA